MAKYKLVVNNECGCFIKRGLNPNQEFDTKEEASTKANELLDLMNKEFCKKHSFSLSEKFGDFTINITPNKR